MAMDDRLFAALSIEMDEHPKIIGLSDRAFRAVIEATFYSRRMLSDGFLDKRVVLRKWGQEAADELSSNDPERPSWIPVEQGWQIHDFEKHNPLRAAIQEKRAATSEAKSAAGRKSGEARRAKAEQNANTTEQDGSITGTNVNPESETETKTKTPNKPSSSEVAVAPIRPDVLMLLERLDMRIKENGGKVPSRTDKNLNAARLLLDRDRIKVEQALAAIDWATNDEFWRTNILSMSKLREKYEQLRLAATRAPRKQGTAPVAKADQNAALYYELYGDGHERTGSISAIDAG